MLRLFAHLFGGSKSTVLTRALKDNPSTIQDGSENGVRRHLVQVLLRDLLRRHGIPDKWIDCQMLIVSSRTRGSGMYVRLVVQHWDERLMNYAAAFQKELVAEIRQFEPQAATWLHGISWQLEVDGSCPYTTLPGKSFWLAPKAETAAKPTHRPIPIPTPKPAPEPAPDPAPERPQAQAERKAEPVNTLELERLFAIRDQALSAQVDQGVVAAGYENTQPAPL